MNQATPSNPPGSGRTPRLRGPLLHIAHMDAPRRRCIELNARGKPCGMAPLVGELRCWAHHPDCAEQRDALRRAKPRSRAQGVRAGSSVPVNTVHHSLNSLARMAEQPGGEAVVCALAERIRDTVATHPNPAVRARLTELDCIAARARRAGEGVSS